MTSATSTQPITAQGASPAATASKGRSPVIRLEGIEKEYVMGEQVVRALRGVDLEVHSHEFVAIMGPSGSGKSTLMHILGCLDHPTRGSYQLTDRRVETLDDRDLSLTRNREIGFVFQSFNLLPQYTIVQNVELPLVYGGTNSRERRQRAEEALARVGLGDRLGHRPNELSGGQRQRVAIARALINRPAMIMADEPTGNLDTRTGAEIMAILEEIAAEGSTIILVTHEPEIALYARRVVHIRDGVVERDESVQEFRDGLDPATLQRVEAINAAHARGESVG